MKVTVIGGSGVFGQRLCDLLAREGHQVTVAARDLGRAQAVAAPLGAAALRLDRSGDLAGLAGAQVVVDASGPFRADVADPWRLQRWCIGQGIHCLDLSDNAPFTAGITALDGAARAAGVAVVSGLSSVPALSAAAVAALLPGLDGAEMIETAILPGNRAPRGRSVVDSILSGTGRPFAAIEGGVPVAVRGWSRPRTFALSAADRRRAWMIEVPDQSLFPGHFGVRTVTFRAGLELPVMNLALAVWSRVRALTGWSLPHGAVSALMALATGLEGLGTDTGGMVVEVTGRRAGAWVCRRWTLRAAGGQGPFVPAVAARALLADPARLVPGARAATGAITLEQAMAAMADLGVTSEFSEDPRPPLFARVSGPDWPGLPPPLRNLHDIAAPQVMRGRADVTRGRGLLARAVAWLTGFPPAGADMPVQVTLTPTPQGEVWERRFGPTRFRSLLAAGPQGLTESFGPLRFAIGLRWDGRSLHFPIAAGWVLGLPLPRILLPVSHTTETAQDDRVQFDVSLSLPLGLGQIVRYRGYLTRV